MLRAFFPLIGLLATAAGASVLAGCTDGADTQEAMAADGGDGPTAEVDAAIDAGPTQRVFGRYLGWFVTDRESIEHALYLQQDVVVWGSRADGGFDRYPGLGGRGEFVVEGVPVGPYWLQLGGNYFAGIPGVPPFELRTPMLGYPDNQLATPGTAVAVALTGLLPWDSQDDLYLFSASGGIADHFTSMAMDRPPVPGDTAVQAAIGLPPGSPLVEGLTRGDQLFVVQARHQALGQTRVWSAGPAMATSRLQMSPGSTAQLNGVLEANPRRLTLEWDPRALLLRAAGDVRFLVTESARLKLSALPGSIVAFLDRGALLALASGDASELPTTFEYTDPFPAAWSRILEYELRFRAYVPVSEQHQCWYMGSIGGAEPAVGDTVTVSSNLAPPRNVRVTSGSTPHVTWEMPDGLFPNGYMLTVYTIEKPTDPDCQATRGPRLFTNFMEARLPPGLLTPGMPAFVVVRAVYDVNFDASPFFTTKGSRYAEAVSGAFFP
jgi:hypothetical protein